MAINHTKSASLGEICAHVESIVTSACDKTLLQQVPELKGDTPQIQGILSERQFTILVQNICNYFKNKLIMK